MHTTLEAVIKKSKNKNLVHKPFSKVSLLFILLLFVYVAGLNIQILLRNQAVLREEILYNKRLILEQKINQDLKKQILLFSEPKFLEKLLREKLGMVKPGEIAYRIVDY